MADEQCDNCRFWGKAGVELVPGHGYCRRRAPVCRPGQAGWPVVIYDDWCGEYEPLPVIVPSGPYHFGDPPGGPLCGHSELVVLMTTELNRVTCPQCQAALTRSVERKDP